MLTLVPTPSFAFDFKEAIVPLDDVFGEGQSKAGTDTGAAAGIDPIELLGVLRQMPRTARPL